MNVRHVGTSWIVDDTVIVTAAATASDRWTLSVHGVKDQNDYESAEEAFEAAMPVAEEIASILKQIDDLADRLRTLGVGIDE